MNMGRIHQLDTNTANMIAAGEVVERPMGVVKELVENAIDAGSTSITISVEEGGLSKITIIDNGCGMSSEDAEMAFERHATSKIKDENDLFSIHTLGFRGEALPSIASVSKVTMITSDGNDTTRVIIAYGTKESVGPYPCNQGTEISVEGLFYHTPARLKHMRSASYESSLIQDVIYKFALSHPEISFHYVNNGRDCFRTSGQGNLLEVVFQVYGRSASENAIQVDFSDFDYHVTGYLIKPEISRASNKMMHIYLNGRMVRTYRIYKAIQDGYMKVLPNGRYPLCVLQIEMDPHLLDVNVHPSKWEVRISKEIQLETLIRDEVEKALNVKEIIPQVEIKEAKVEYYQPLSFEEELRPEPKPTISQQMQEEAKQDEKILQEIQTKIESKQEVIEELEEEIPFPLMHPIGQYHQRYILCEMEKGICIIDQAQAMRKIIYNEIYQQLGEEETMMELLLPITLHTGSDVVNRIDEINSILQDMHIVFEAFGTDTCIVRAIPTWLQNIQKEDFLQDVLDAFQNETIQHLKQSIKEKVAQLASAHIIKKVSTLSNEEMQSLIAQLSQCNQPFTGVDKKPLLIVLDEVELMKGFKR